MSWMGMRKRLRCCVGYMRRKIDNKKEYSLDKSKLFFLGILFLHFICFSDNLQSVYEYVQIDPAMC